MAYDLAPRLPNVALAPVTDLPRVNLAPATLTHRRRNTVKFTSTSIWTAPANVVRVSLEGKGAPGTSDHNEPQSAELVTVNYFSSGSGVPGSSFDWSGMQSVADSNLSKLNAGGSQNLNQLIVSVYPDQTNTINDDSTVSYTNIVASTASVSYSGGWQSSGPASSSGAATFLWSEFVAAAAGASASAFGKTFPGGDPNTPADTTRYFNVQVTPKQPYTITVPAGGYVTIEYYQ